MTHFSFLSFYVFGGIRRNQTRIIYMNFSTLRLAKLNFFSNCIPLYLKGMTSFSHNWLPSHGLCVTYFWRRCHTHEVGRVTDFTFIYFILLPFARKLFIEFHIVQRVLCIHGFCIHRFNQSQVKNIWKKIQKVPKNKIWICLTQANVYIAFTLC